MNKTNNFFGIDETIESTNKNIAKLQAKLDNKIAKLKEPQQAIIKLRYGFANGQAMNINDVAKTLDLTVPVVREFECKALKKLRSVHPNLKLLYKKAKAIEKVEARCRKRIKTLKIQDVSEERGIERFRNAVEQLPEPEKTVMKMKFGIADGKRYTVEEIADIMEITSEEVAKIKADAIKMLRYI